MNKLPEPWRSVYTERQSAILQRLLDFSDVPPDQYFYELAFCILTPQSSAANAEATIAELVRDHFLERGFDPMSYLRDAKHYIRFHNVKAKRLLEIRERFPDLLPYLLDQTATPEAKREIVLASVKGLGMKEASHFLRNIGVRGLAILDRHIFKHLTRLGVINEIPMSGPTKKRYLEIERLWHEYAKRIDISLDELDLLFWSMETGEIRK
ncbi:MAG: DNA lyase [Bacteroidota bacterium]|nr:DNA lyase [Bacteroidota bacterium]MDP4233441.1 DNA lyase [Bacteroidota bacterium]MDP4242307.1 DNA lyase [Bacteroidota bacterium]MDP4287063.1 DNA lyase [Bacteroidota bacterium]